MARTRETASIVAESLGLPVTEASGFRECDFGLWDGLTYDQVRSDHGVGLSEWFSSTDVAPPGGESFAQVQDRIAQARTEVMREYAGRTVLVVTHVTPIERLDGATLVSCQLETGRTHQIRIHLAEAGHPLVGEKVYIRNYRGEPILAPRLMLHAAELGFDHPSDERPMRFEDPPPSDFQEVLARLRIPA